MRPLKSSDALHFNCIHVHLGSTKALKIQYICKDLFHSIQKIKRLLRKSKACLNLAKPRRISLELASIVPWIFRRSHSCDSHGCVDTRAGGRCPLTVSRVPSLRAYSVFGHALSSTSQPRDAFYLPSKNHTSFKSHTSRDPWKDAAICFANIYYISEDAPILQRIKSLSGGVGNRAFPLGGGSILCFRLGEISVCFRLLNALSCRDEYPRFNIYFPQLHLTHNIHAAACRNPSSMIRTQ